ncbi:thiol reductase thioredoxin [Paenibacillus sp. PK3_47]|uniref:thioredoxin family protein n=1 Tax=Paenibacillus sp. PK3_47 TaxID=2072642 RepID=UPI00201E57D7|nr:thioredoxin family protein [Paenibacillus sp. PK3_47]UQZ33396.1 thiol reductase thioredoxin [Paenibacillus sp. PK3_47]
MKEVIELTSVMEIDDFLKKNELSFLYVSTPGCSICHALLPKLQELLSRYPLIIFGHIDAGKVQEVAGKFLILSAPVMLLMIGQKEVLREDRFVRFDVLQEKLDRIYRMFNGENNPEV